MLIHVLIKHCCEASELVQQLRALTASPENPGLIPSTHMLANNYNHHGMWVRGGLLMPFCGLYGHHMNKIDRYPCRQNTHTQKNKIFLNLILELRFFK